ncbi:hypothetical protein DFH06DRAFT_1482043, partial [Mycena polygramma]
MHRCGNAIHWQSLGLARWCATIRRSDPRQVISRKRVCGKPLLSNANPNPIYFEFLVAAFIVCTIVYTTRVRVFRVLGMIRSKDDGRDG